MKTRIAIVLGLALACLAPVQARGPAPYQVAETGEYFGSLQQAVAAIGSGRGTIRIAPGRYRDCAVQEGGEIAFVAAERGTAVFDGGACEDKATLVLRGRSASVDGLVFVNVRVADGNGAGIRLEQGDLEVAYTRFADGQCGILTANGRQGSISIDHSTFSGLGKHPDGDGAHSLYVGDYGRLKVTSSRFERGTGGHYLKSRAARIEVLDSSFDDSHGRRTNYLIDLSNGAAGRIAGNVFVNGTAKENRGAMLTVAPEGAANSSAGLVIENNDVSVVPGFRWHTAFIADWSGEKLVVRGNRVAPGIALLERR
ncbi:MAG TPA: right-handed parallel beta-helix repeat-containing protein [Allosphingosinicella sp.]|nr:right-handed parallel beta-helix repeat-containing protein [Allosphingosinicella sp.]